MVMTTTRVWIDWVRGWPPPQPPKPTILVKIETQQIKFFVKPPPHHLTIRPLTTTTTPMTTTETMTMTTTTNYTEVVKKQDILKEFWNNKTR